MVGHYSLFPPPLFHPIRLIETTHTSHQCVTSLPTAATMAEEDDHLDRARFWLPSEFLADDLFLHEGKIPAHGDLDSPADAESEEDKDADAGMRTRISFLLEDEEEEEDGISPSSSTAFSADNLKDTAASSPQSTLCGMGSWSMLSRGSSDEASQVSSPSSPLEGKGDEAWDLLYSAAGQMAHIKLQDEDEQPTNPRDAGASVLSQSTFSSRIAIPPRRASAGTGVFVNPSLAQQTSHVNKFRQPKKQQQQQQQQQQAKQGKQSGGWGGHRNGASVQPLGLPSSAWPPLKQQQQKHQEHEQQQHPLPQSQSESDMRVVFLRPQEQVPGTGVFLPKTTASTTTATTKPTRSRKKPECPTVLIPARVLRALNAHARFPGGVVLDQDAIRSHNVTLLQKRGLLPQPFFPSPAAAVVTPAAAIAADDKEIQLPSEWTY